MASSNYLECPICQLSLTTRSNVSNTNDGDAEEHDELIQIDRNINQEAASRWSSPVCTPCGHMFHKACITEWFRVRRNVEGGSSLRGSCPTCRKVISYHKLIRVYLSIPTSCPSPQSSTPAALSSWTRGSVMEAVRQYSERYLNMRSRPHLEGRFANQCFSRRNDYQSYTLDRDSGRIYHDFFTICFGNRNQDPYESGDDYSSTEVVCERECCVALRNVHRALTNEFKTLQRRLGLETEVSKMKSLLVTRLQKDVDKMKRKVRFVGDTYRIIGGCLTLCLALMVVSFLSLCIVMYLLED